MTSKEIRQSFLDFFRSKQHTIVPSSSLMPESPGLLFTNAGMNQFVPFFLGTQKAPYDPARATDTQKCIRAGGKQNDLDDVGWDTYHQTMFEMLGNWSFGDYFKKEAITWAWELIVDVWKIPKERIYATVYMPGDGDPGEFDQEAYDLWAEVLTAAGLDPAVHIVNGDAKDNFWMMGDTGPCGPCSELHIDLTPDGDTGGKLVNKDDAACIELWNLVFIQYNAEADGTFRPLPACHIDTGMGFERACSFIQGTKGFTDFSKPVSNYETDVFFPLFAELEKLSGKKYASTLPASRENLTDQEKDDVALRVIADHIRTLSFGIADGIIPNNNGRNYVLRRILRRAVRYGRTIGLGGADGPFLSKLLPTFVAEFGETFPEIIGAQAKIIETLDAEEALFNKTLDRGLKLFNKEVEKTEGGVFSGDAAFELEATFGFPVDLTELMAVEHGLKLDMGQYEIRQAEHATISAAGGTKTIVAAVDRDFDTETEFVGFDQSECEATVVEAFSKDDAHFILVDKSPFYAEKGGQVGDSGSLDDGGETIAVLNTSAVGAAFLLQVEKLPTSTSVKLQVDSRTRHKIESHHSATHVMHWALHQHVGDDVAQQGSFVGPERLRFDFNSSALDAEQVAAVETLVNEKIAAGDIVSWQEVKHADISAREDIMQFFGDKYGDVVRVVQIGGGDGTLDGYSMELCGGTHVRNTSDIGLFKIKSEGAIAAGIRRIEAVCGDAAGVYLQNEADELEAEINELSARFEKANAALEQPVAVAAIDGGVFDVLRGTDPSIASSLEGVNTALDTIRSHRDALKNGVAEAQKLAKKAEAAEAAKEADAKLGELIEAAAGDIPLIAEHFQGGPALLQEMLNSLKKKAFAGVGVLVIEDDGKVHLGTYVSSGLTDRFQAGKLIGELGPLVGGKGGGKPEMARGAGNDPSGIPALLKKARELVV
ncbi:MAG: alanyl-tRNA synthetase [Pseudoalteromonas tetraodonis]|jgi:alanyl-tRNA synthetase